MPEPGISASTRKVRSESLEVQHRRDSHVSTLEFSGVVCPPRDATKRPLLRLPLEARCAVLLLRVVKKRGIFLVLVVIHATAQAAPFFAQRVCVVLFPGDKKQAR